MPRVPTPRLTLYAERAGAGARLLWISGSGGDLRNPPHIFETPLAKSFDMVAYDQRGLGQSDKPDAVYTMADYADDAAALMDAIGWDRAHVAGYSFGGMVAQHVAIRHPQRVDRLVLGATSSGGEGGSSYPLHELQALSQDERIRRSLLLDSRLTEARLANPSPGIKAQIEMRKAAEALRDKDTEGLKGAERQFEARRHHDAWEGLAHIPHPTLVCAGAFDRLASPQNARNLATRIPNATLRFYKGGHGFLVEGTDFYADMIAFLHGATLQQREEQDVLQS